MIQMGFNPLTPLILTTVVRERGGLHLLHLIQATK